MVEIGSRDDPQPQPGAAPGDSGEVLGTAAESRPRWRLPTVTPVVGWGVAAAMAAAAPFVAFNTLEVQLPNGRLRVASVDGWGRDHPHQALQFYGHGVRFGIALWACALCLVAASVLCVLAGRAGRSAAAAAGLQRRAMFVAIAAPSALAGVVGSMVLAAQTYVDQRDAISAARQPALTAGEAVYQPGYGGGVWLSVAALVLAVLSSFAFLRGLLLKPLSDGARLDATGP